MRIIYDKLSLEVVQVVEDENSITAFPSNLGVIQGDDTLISTMIVSLGLNFNGEIPNTINMSEEMKSVLRKKNKGQQIINRFLEENEQIVISTEQNLIQLSNFMNVKLLLETGALSSAKDALVQLSSESFILTPNYNSSEERKQSYIDEIDQFLNQI